MRTAILLAVLLTTLPGTLFARQQVEPGTRIMVKVEDPFDGRVNRAATFQGWQGDTLWVDIGGRRVALDARNAEPRMAGAQRHGGAGAWVGALAGALVGGAVAYGSYQPDMVTPQRCTRRTGYISVFDCRDLTPEDRGSRGLRTALGGSLGALSGAALGYLIGSAVKNWVPVDGASVSVAPTGFEVRLPH